ncbi:hypothetical protein GSY69_04650 [Brevibacterium sp. 5221]|uniref:AMP-dependent synthetase/ligase domain-containing protein n=1 Tax=Brevibacterium rongguiense TaxID=2695267 RepID=A0A6N9H5E1_9MICO|nr:AMP-binding protein [Brevibacterium rongguiense]MYM19278.1 hypothetical protein [Brevibacterium rongguiense]
MPSSPLPQVAPPAGAPAPAPARPGGAEPVGERPGAQLTAVWDGAVRVHGQRLFLVFGNSADEANEWTFAQFDMLTGLTARRMAERGVRPGSTVRAALFNSPELLLCWLAAARLNARFELIDPNALTPEPAVPGALIVAGRGPGRPGAAAYPGANVLEVNEDFAGMLAGSPLFGAQELTSAQAARLTGAAGPSPAPAAPGAAVPPSTPVPASAPGRRWLLSKPLWKSAGLEDCLVPAIAAGRATALAALFDPARTAQQAALLGADRVHLTALAAQRIIAEAPVPDPGAGVALVWVRDAICAREQAELARIFALPVDRVLSGPPAAAPPAAPAAD